MKPFFLFFLILFSVLQLGAATRSEFYPEFKIYSEVNDYEYYRINSYFVQTAYLFDKIYGLKFPKYTLEVNIDDKTSSNVFKTVKTPGTVVIITNQKLLFPNTQSFNKTLIKKLLFAELSIPGDKCNDSDAEWIVLGTLREINRQKILSFTPDFPILNQVVQNGGKLDYQNIITFNISEETGILRNYFAEESQVLLSAILKKNNGREFIFEYMENICSESKNDKKSLFDNLLKKYQTTFGLTEEKTSTSFNEYLNKIAVELVINPGNPLSIDKTVDEFNKIVNFKDIATDKKIHINTLAEYLKDKKNRDSIIQQEKNIISRFASSINILLVAPVQKMIDLLDRLKNKKHISETEYSETMNEQIKSFYNTVSRLKQIEKYLFETECKKSNIGRKYNLYLRELEKQNDPVDRAYPELRNFLDENYSLGIN